MLDEGFGESLVCNMIGLLQKRLSIFNVQIHNHSLSGSPSRSDSIYSIQCRIGICKQTWGCEEMV